MAPNGQTRQKREILILNVLHYSFKFYSVLNCCYKWQLYAIMSGVDLFVTYLKNLLTDKTELQ